MREFVKDYAKMCKDGCVFYKKHWKGVILMNAAFVAAEYAYIYRESLKNTFREKFSKKKS